MGHLFLITQSARGRGQVETGVTGHTGLVELAAFAQMPGFPWLHPFTFSLFLLLGGCKGKLDVCVEEPQGSRGRDEVSQVCFCINKSLGKGFLVK